MMHKQLLIIGLSLSLGLSACGGEEMPPNMAAGPDMLDGGLGSSLDPMMPMEPMEPAFPGAGMTTPANDPYAEMYTDPMADGTGYDTGAAYPEDAYPEDPSVGYPAEPLPEALADPSAQSGLTDALPALDDSSELPALDDLGGTEDLPVLDDLGSSDDLAIGELPDMDVSDPFNPGAGSGYNKTDAFKVDQDRMNQWQAVNIASDGSQIFVAAVDRKSPSKGTVIRLDGSGENWNDLSTSWAGSIDLFDWSYSLKPSITSLALNSSGQLLVADQSARVYTAEGGSRYTFNEISVNGLNNTLDTLYANGHYYIATPLGIQQLSSSFGIPSTFSSLRPTGGLAAHNEDLYAVVNNEVHRINASGQSSRVLSGLDSPIDVAVDSEGQIFVLSASGIRWFDASGTEQGEFGLGEFIQPRGLCLDSSGAVYVADEGNDHSDSQIVKFSR